MPDIDSTSWGTLGPVLVLSFFQSLIGIMLAYISKLLRDIRSEIGQLDSRLGCAEVEIRAGAKLLETTMGDFRREQDLIHRRLERVEERHT